MTNTALIIIDVQQGFNNPVWGKRNNPDAESNIAKLIGLWRREKRPIVHIQHRSVEPDSPLRPGLPGCEFKPEAMPEAGEPVFQKTVNSGFIGTGLEAYLRDQGIVQLVAAGLTTDHCVSTTVRMAGNLGFKVQLVADATATFDRRGPDGRIFSADDIHAIHLASLHGEFCEVVSTASLMATQEGSEKGYP